MKILTANPAGNITVFVLDPVESREERSAIAREILADSRAGAGTLETSLRNPPPEQVGFVIPGSDSALWRLEMAGGEFCGNAARCFGLYVAGATGIKGKAVVLVSVSGAAAPVQVQVDTENGFAAAEMPKPRHIDVLNFSGHSLPVLVFEGITHVIAPDLKPEKGLFFNIKAELEKKHSSPAAGVMFYDTAARFMRPAVYVSSPESFVFESSCGSGSAALAVWFSRGMRDGTANYLINQPGGVIETEITKAEGKIIRITIGGKVELGAPVNTFYSAS